MRIWGKCEVSTWSGKGGQEMEWKRIWLEAAEMRLKPSAKPECAWMRIEGCGHMSIKWVCEGRVGYMGLGAERMGGGMMSGNQRRR